MQRGTLIDPVLQQLLKSNLLGCIAALAKAKPHVASISCKIKPHQTLQDNTTLNCFLSAQNAIWHFNNKAKTAEAACSIARSLELSIARSPTATRARALDWYLKVCSHSAVVLR